MRNALLSFLLLCTVAMTAAYGADFFVQSVAAGNGSSTVSSALPTANAQYSIQCSATSTYRVCATSSCTATATDFTVPSAGMDLPVTTDNSSPPQAAKYVAFYGVASAATCNIYRVIPATLPGF